MIVFIWCNCPCDFFLSNPFLFISLEMVEWQGRSCPLLFLTRALIEVLVSRRNHVCELLWPSFPPFFFIYLFFVLFGVCAANGWKHNTIICLWTRRRHRRRYTTETGKEKCSLRPNKAWGSHVGTAFSTASLNSLLQAPFSIVHTDAPCRFHFLIFPLSTRRNANGRRKRWTLNHQPPYYYFYISSLFLCVCSEFGKRNAGRACFISNDSVTFHFFFFFQMTSSCRK